LILTRQETRKLIGVWFDIHVKKHHPLETEPVGGAGEYILLIREEERLLSSLPAFIQKRVKEWWKNVGTRSTLTQNPEP
jgi:hypothetical protein